MMNGNKGNKIDYRMPLYIQVQDILLKRIEEEEYLPGSKIPSERELASIYDVNRMTVRKAIDELVKSEYLYRVQGKGTFVSNKTKDKLDLGYVEGKAYYGTTDLIESAGGKAHNKLLGKEKIYDNKYLQSRLHLGEGESVYGIRRVRYKDDKPLIIETVYIPLKYFVDIEDIDIENASLYDYMNEKEHVPIKYTQKMQITKANKNEAKYLEIAEGKNIYYCEYIARDEDGNVVEYAEEYSDPDSTEVKFYF